MGAPDTSCYRCGTTGLAVLAVLALFLQAVAAGEHAPLGCYADRAGADDARDLPDSVFLDDRMSPAFCGQMCGSRRFKYFGLQYGNECWCGGPGGYGRYGASTACTMACVGDDRFVCGGLSANSVYEVDRSQLVADPDVEATLDGASAEQRPLLALVMILKNEAGALPATVRPLAPFLDAWYILDTGSKDGTQGVVQRELASKVPGGELWEEKFVDYGTSRNRVLDIATSGGRAGGPRPVFALMLSADEIVYNAAELRAFLEARRHSTGFPHEAYAVQLDLGGGTRFDSVRVVRVDSGWRYCGRVHEYLAPPANRPGHYAPLRVPGAYIRFRATDGERRTRRNQRILELLELDKRDNPGDPRAAFYLARGYSESGQHERAAAEFERRVRLGGWSEEVFESMLGVAESLRSLGRPEGDVRAAFLRAAAHSPARAEPLHRLAQLHRHAGELHLALMYASEAAALPFPDKVVLWISRPLYQTGAALLAAEIAADIVAASRGGPFGSRLAASCLWRGSDAVAAALVAVESTAGGGAQPPVPELESLRSRYVEWVGETGWERVVSRARERAQFVARFEKPPSSSLPPPPVLSDETTTTNLVGGFGQNSDGSEDDSYAVWWLLVFATPLIVAGLLVGWRFVLEKSRHRSRRLTDPAHFL